MKLGADPGSKAAGRESGAGNGANRGVGEGACVGDTLSRERLDVRRLHPGFVEETEVVLGVVFGYDPDEIGTIRRDS